MCPACLVQGPQKARTTVSSSKRSSALKAIPFMSLDLTPGHGNLLGESYWEMVSPWLGGSSILNTGPAPLKEEDVYSLSQILQDDPPRKYYLSRTACLGILRRAKERGKELPPQLHAALMAQAGLAGSEAEPTTGVQAYHINQRNEGIDLGGIAGALMRTQNIQMQTFVTQPPAAFAANQRDEVRDLHDVAGTLAAQPGMKQQTFIAQNCLNPWDTQQARVFTPEGKAPTLTGADGGGGRNPAGLLFTAGFSANAGGRAGSIGFQKEVAPTLKGAQSGGMMPSVLCLNDQGGSVMECSEDLAGTLRAQEHGHQPLVFENHGIDARYTGPHPISPTITARAGTGGGTLPLALQAEHRAAYSRQKVDVFKDNDVASTESARQHKDATDLVCQPSDVEDPLLIRRLMPSECELLQGFPLGWTDLPGASDSARYKALGNSVSIPCVEYVMRGIVAALQRRVG